MLQSTRRNLSSAEKVARAKCDRYVAVAAPLATQSNCSTCGSVALRHWLATTSLPNFEAVLACPVLTPKPAGIQKLSCGPVTKSIHLGYVILPVNEVCLVHAGSLPPVLQL